MNAVLPCSTILKWVFCKGGPHISLTGLIERVIVAPYLESITQEIKISVGVLAIAQIGQQCLSPNVVGISSGIKYVPAIDTAARGRAFSN